MQLVSKIFNLCGHDPPMSQTDGQIDRWTDRQSTCDRKTTLCTIVHRTVKIGVVWGWGRSPKVTSNVSIQQSAYNFLFDFNGTMHLSCTVSEL